MWNRDESRSPEPADAANGVPSPQRPNTPGKEPRTARLGISVLVKGKLTGSEDLTIDGQVEGEIDLSDNTLTVGPNAKVRAEIVARVVIVFGTVDGAITAQERVDIRRGASVEGNLVCARVGIQEGAHFTGKVDMGNRRPAARDTASDKAPALMEMV